MVRKLIIAIALFSLGAAASAQPVRRTVIVRDGKVVTDDGDFTHRGYLGFTPIDISPELREHFGATKESGILVGAVKEGAPAAKAGLRVGDVIVSIDGKKVDDVWDVSDTIGTKKAGDAVRIEVIRDRARLTLMATVEERDLTASLRALKIPSLERVPMIQAWKMSGGDTVTFPKVPMNGDVWQAVIEPNDCGDLQMKIQDLENRLRDLEKKLQK